MISDFAIYQLIIFSISCVLILRTAFLLLQKKKTYRELILALFIWGGFGLLGLYPNFTTYIAHLTGFQLGINALLVSSVLILFYSVIIQSLKNDKLENSITKIVRNLALEKLRQENKNKSNSKVK